MTKVEVIWNRMANGSKNYAKFMAEGNDDVDTFEKAQYVKKTSLLKKAKTIKVTYEVVEEIEEDE